MMYWKYQHGIIEVIAGPMFSGKSEELIKRIKILGHSKTKTLVVKPSIDIRWGKEQIVSRAGTSISTIAAQSSQEILDKIADTEYQAIAIDEAQFFDQNIVAVIKQLAKQGIRVIVSGLDQDFRGEPFGPMPQILAIADRVDKQIAICQKCQKAATMTYRKNKSRALISIGDHEYEPRCRACHSEQE